MRTCSLLILAGAVAFGAQATTTRTVGEPVDLEFKPILLNPTNPEQKRIGAFSYKGGWSIASDHGYFGGWSAVSIQGARLTLLSDRGTWLSAAFDPADQDKLLKSANIGIISGRGPTWFDKYRTDLEAATPIYPSGFLVSFEHNHRLEVMTERGGWHAPVPMPTGVMEGLSPNSGIEAMTFDTEDRLLLFAERGRRAARGLPSWRISATHDGQKQSEAFYLKLPAGHSPTAARALPNGTIIILSRSFSLLKGTTIGLFRLSLPDRVKGLSIEPERLGLLQSPLVTENFEGLDLFRTSSSGERYGVILVSDDNFNPVQSTLLLMFELDVSKL